MNNFTSTNGICYVCRRKGLLPALYGTINISSGTLCLDHARFYCTQHFRKHKEKYHESTQKERTRC